MRDLESIPCSDTAYRDKEQAGLCEPGALRSGVRPETEWAVESALPVGVPLVHVGQNSTQGSVHFREVAGPFENLTWFRAVRGTDEAVLFHQVDEVGGAAVADAQTALQQ